MDRPVTVSVPAQQSEDIAIECYESEMPSFVESELERLYGQIYSSLAFFRLFKPSDNVSTYVVRRGGEAITVLVFRRENGRVEVFNEMIRIDAGEIDRFADYIFRRFPSVS
ncbi:MAG: hypothetical protein V7642_4088, partial [Burkholderiales bacterium]